MKISEQYHHLKAALDPRRARAVIENGLTRSQGRKTEIAQLFITRVFPRENDSFAVQYQVQLKGDSIRPSVALLLWGHLLGPDGVIPKYASENESEVILDCQLGLVIPIFPYDPQMPILNDLSDRVRLGDLLEDNGLHKKLQSGSYGDIDLSVMAYRLERRSVWQLTIRGANEQRLVIRTMRPRKAEAILMRMRHLTPVSNSAPRPDSLTVPQLLAADEVNGLAFIEFVAGRSLHDLPEAQGFGPACRATGRVLRQLHEQDQFGDAIHTVDDELTALGEKVTRARHIFPELQVPLEAAFQDLQSDRTVATEIGCRCCIHGDFYDKQVLWDEKRTTLLDTDQLSNGDAAQDVGNFLAHLVLRQQQGRRQGDHWRLGREQFIDGYGKTDKLFQARTEWWCRAALIRLAVLYALRPRWHHLVEGLLQGSRKRVSGQGSRVGL